MSDRESGIGWGKRAPRRTTDAARIDAAEHLILIARDLRAAGDVALVRLDDDGVAPDHLTLAGELELIAMQLDFDGCMDRAKEDRERSQ